MCLRDRIFVADNNIRYSIQDGANPLIQNPKSKMTLVPLSHTVSRGDLSDIRLVATDFDGTLTQQGKLTSAVLQALEALRDKGIAVIIVTGRSAGWVSALRNYLPVEGAIAENGGLFYSCRSEIPELLTPIRDRERHRQILAQAFEQCKRQIPHLQESADNRFRLTDWTFDVQGLGDEPLQQLSQWCEREGWSFTYSTVQCHIKPAGQDKATALLQVWQQHFANLTPAQILTVGDSPNDESLFERAKFPHSVGVANIKHYRDRLHHLPAYITAASEGAGFCELARLL